MDPSSGEGGAIVEVDDVWGGDDDELGHYSQTDTDLQREWESRRTHFHTLGYRDGISAGKESEAQIGFNRGFKEAVVAGYSWGVARGVASAFAVLNPSLKELLLKDQEAIKRVEDLNSSAASISSDEALRVYYEESILPKDAAVPEGDLQSAAALEISSSAISEANGCCSLQRLSLETATDDNPTCSGETSEIRPCSNSSRSSVPSVSTDEETISDVGYADACRTIIPDFPPGVPGEISDANRSSRPCTRLELLQAEVEKEFKSTVLKLSVFPQ